MTQELLQEQLTSLQANIEKTLNLIRELIEQSNEMTELISSLEKTQSANESQIKSLKKINIAINEKLAELTNALSELLENYNLLLQKAL